MKLTFRNENFEKEFKKAKDKLKIRKPDKDYEHDSKQLEIMIKSQKPK